MTKIPGIKAKHAIITDTCQANRGTGKAFGVAVARLRKEYNEIADAWEGRGAKIHLVMTLERPDDD